MDKMIEAAQAQVYGNMAFKSGKSSAPCQDQNCMDMLKGREIGTSLHILKAWTSGWHQANLSNHL